MRINKELSIIIPVYQAIDFLERCVGATIECQSQDYEIILIDDGSTDGSSILCDNYAQKDNRIKVIHQSNSGVSSARNRGLDAAEGRWIWFVDADDTPAPKIIPILMNILTQTSADTLIGGMTDIYESGMRKDVRWPYKSGDTDKLLEWVNVYQNGMILFSQEIIKRYNLRFVEGTKIGEDLEFQYRYMARSRSILVIREIIYHYYIREGSVTRRDDTLATSAGDIVKIVSRLIDMAVELNLKSEIWLIQRIRAMYKSGLNAVMLMKSSNRKALVGEFRNLRNKLTDNGMSPVIDRTIALALRFPMIYSNILTIRVKNN